MKRILALLLVLAMSVGLFAGCGEQTPDVTTQPTQPTVEAQPDLQLEKAIEYLRAFYKNVAEKTPMDYTRLGTVRIGITSYDVVWSVDAPEEVLKIVKNADGSYTIDINEEAIKESTEPTPYVLTATITGKDGRELTISWNHIVPAAIDEESIEVIKKAYALAAGETLEGTYTVSGVIKAIKTPYDPSYKNITVTIEVPGAEDMPIVCYRLKGNGADKLAVGDTITVTGNFTNYNGQIQFAAGCILEAVESGGGAAPVAPENPLDILKQAYALAPGNSLPYNCTLSGVITFVDEGYNANYGNITVTMKTHGYTIKCYRMKGDGIDQLNVNDEITVSGQITNYNGTIEFGAGCMLISRVDHEPPAAIPDPTPGTNVTIADAIAIGRGKDHDTYTEGKYYVTGKIVSIENDYYGNMHIADGNGNKLMIYGSYSEDGNTRFGDLPTKPTVGDTITVYGAIGRYGSNPQMKNAWIMGAKGDSPVIPDAPSVDQVTELVAGTPYRFGMTQGNLENAVYYLAGGMSGYYMATTADPTAAINVYVEETAGGYYFYTLDGETKLYINMVVSADGAHVNGAYEAAASTVYTYNAASNTLIATVDGAEYWFGTRNDKTYTTMGPCAVEYAGFFGQFYVGSEEGPEQPDEPEVPDVSELVAGKAYKFGMAQGNLNNKVFYLAGGMDGYYMATTDDINAAIDVYVEVTEGGYYFYTLDGETKLYINMVVNGTHVNGAYEATASTVYTYNAEKNTLIGIVNDAEYWFSTRNDNTYTTMGPNKVSYNGFYGQFYDPNAEEPDEPDVPVVPEDPEVPDVSELVAGKAYKFGMIQKNVSSTDVYYLAGGMDGYYMATNKDVTAAIDVYVEETEGGYYFYTLDGETKLYINMVVSGTHVNGAYEAAASTVYTYDAENNTLIAIVNDAEYWFGTRNDKTYTTVGPCAVSYAGFFCQFYDLNAEPECEHKNTKVEGRVEATCTEAGHTGKTVCSDCGEVLIEGEIIAALGHNFENGTCTKCGEADPDYTPEQPEAPTGGKADFNTIVTSNANGGDSSYTKTFTTTNGWVIKNSAIQIGGATVMNPQFPVIGPDNTHKAVCMNGKVSAPGSITSPTLTGGISKLTMKYTKIFTDTKLSATITITDLATGTVYTNTAAIEWDKNTKYEVETFEWILETPITGDFTIVVVNDCPTGQTGNKDRMTILELAWEASAAPEQPECQHQNTEIEGRVEATCTEAGHTGKTVCSDCGEVLIEGEIIAALGHNFENGTCTACGEKDPNYTEPEEPSTGLEAGKAYKFGMIQQNVSSTDVYYLAGGMSSYYMATNKDVTAAIDVYVEATEGGYYFYTLDGETKLYINMVVSADGAHVNGAYEAAASTVYTYDAENNTLIAIVNNTEYWFGTRNDKTYTTVGPCAVSYAGFFCQFYPVEEENPEPECKHNSTVLQGATDKTCTTHGYTGDVVCLSCGKIIEEGRFIPALGHTFVDGTCTACGEKDPNYTEPEEPSTGLEAGKAYKFGMIQKNVSSTDVYYLAGGMSSYYMATNKDVTAAIDVYVEATEGGYYFYTLDGETKLYINMVVSADGAHVNGAYEAAASTVYTYDAENNTLIAIVNNTEYWFGTRNDKTYTTVGPCAVSYAGFFCQFYPVVEENPDAPFCQHLHTEIQGAVEATCTKAGYTGDTVCTDCGETVKGEEIPMIAHTFANGTCSVCGAEDPNYTEPEQPSTGLEAGKAYKFGMAQGNLNNKVFYLAGGMDGYYMATTDDINAAIDVYVEETEGGYYFYTLDGETKLYINMVVSGTHVNGAYEATASTVYTYNAEKNTLIGIVNDAEYWFSTRNDNTYTTMGPNKVSYNGFYGQFYDPNATEPDVPVVPDEPEVPDVSDLEADKAYKFGMAQGNLNNKVFYLAGGMDGYYMATTDDINAAIDVYVEVTEGGYYFYTLDGETKLYINMVVSGTHVNGAYEATASTVYTYNAEKNTLIGIVNDAEYWFSTRNDNTYTTMGPNKVSYNGFYGQFYDLNAESECKHTNTKVEGRVEATCTEDGYSGDTVCSDCGEVLHKGESSAALGHPFVDGICPKCGEADPNYIPLEPEEIGKAYKLCLDRGEKWYFAGAMGYSSLTTTDNMNAATDVYLEEVEGGFRFYFMDGETKTYIDIYEYETGKVRVRLTTEPTAVFIFNKDLGIYQTAIYTAYVAGAHRFLGANGLDTSISAWDVKYITGENIGDLGVRYYITGFVEVAGEDPEQPTYEHVFGTDTGYAVSLSEDGTRLNCYQLGSETIYYKTYFAEKPEQGNFEVREYNGKIYYASISSWGTIPFESYTISGNVLELAMYDFEGTGADVVVLELNAENQYTITAGTDSLPEGMVFEFGPDVCAIMGHCASQQCEDDVLCNTCEKFICAGFGHEFGDGTICFRCFAAEKPEEPTTPVVLATFTFPNGSGNAWVDGNAMAAGSATYTDDGYTLTFANYSKIYAGGCDPHNNGFIKFGTSSVVGTLTFTVPENVTSVELHLSGYKAKTSKYSINGGNAVTLTKSANDGEYDVVIVDTSVNKTITLSTASGATRMVMYSIIYKGTPA